MKKAFIDLGTNTFHLLIVEFPEKKVLYKTSVATQLGKGGINQERITAEATERAITVLKAFAEQLTIFGVAPTNCIATGTSAIRNAKNQEEFRAIVLQETGITIEVLSGEDEAQLIYEGVKQAVVMNETSMIVDIGGGSVEFIIARLDTVLWKQSFEIGGQRLMEIFMKTDPISQKSVGRMDDYFREKLLPLANACHQYHPKILVGSSGSFDTLIDMFFMKTKLQLPDNKEISFQFPLDEFYKSYEQLVFSNRSERMAIAGMIELRVDMIVVAMCLIRYLIQTFAMTEIKVSRYALKEGLMNR